jgi:hypothetical protein
VTTKRLQSSGTASVGVHCVAKVTNEANCLFHEVDQKNDIGNDAFIEFIVEQTATGCCIATQIKSGSSYVRNGRFFFTSDEKHFKYWRNHFLPFCGFVYDPVSDTVRWVDITAHVSSKPTQFTIELPDDNIFDRAHFDSFRDHFLSYRPLFSDAANFGKALKEFSHTEDSARCVNGIRALFSFHRNQIETWYFVVSTINNFRGHPLLRFLVATLAHVPGHMDIFWVPGKNTIPESVCAEAELVLKRMLSRDSILTLLGAIDDGGIERGTIGQCVDAIVHLAPHRRECLESIIFDANVPADLRYWALLLQIIYEQNRDHSYCVAITEKASSYFTDEEYQERVRSILETLKTPGFRV